MSERNQRVLTDLIENNSKVAESTIPTLVELAIDDAQYVSTTVDTLSETLKLIAEGEIEISSCTLEEMLTDVESLLTLVPELSFDLSGPIFALLDHNEASIRATGLYYAGFVAHLADKDLLRLCATAEQSLTSDSHKEQIAAYHCLANIGLAEPACLDSVRSILTQSLWPANFTEKGYGVEDVCAIRRYAAIAIAAQAEAGLGSSESRRCISSGGGANQATAAHGIERVVTDTELPISEWGPLSPARSRSQTEAAIFEALVEALVKSLSQNSKAEARQSLYSAIAAVVPLQEGYADTLANVHSLLSNETNSTSQSSNYRETVFKEGFVDQLTTHQPDTAASAEEFHVDFLELGPYTSANTIGIPHRYRDELGIQTFADYSPLVTFQEYPQLAGLAHILHPEEDTVKIHPKVASLHGIEKGEIVRVKQLSSVPAQEVTIAIPRNVQTLLDNFEVQHLREHLRGEPLSDLGGISINLLNKAKTGNEILENHFSYSTFLRAVPDDALYTLQLPVSSTTPTTATRMTRTTTIEFISPSETTTEIPHIQYPESCDDDFELVRK